MSTPSVRELPKEHEGLREISLAQAVNEALAEELRRDPTVFVVGEDVAEAGTPFKVLSGLVDEFGAERVIDTPISEAGITGIGLGAAMTGMRPVVDIMFGDFLTLVMDQVVNQAAKVHYMSGGRLRAPLTIRTTLGATRRSAAQHSQSLHAWVAHVPGLKVAVPATPYDAKGLLKSAIRDDNPVVFFEDKMMFATKGPVPDGEYTVPFGVADTKREGDDVTLVATSSMVYVALAAADLLADDGVSAEVIDPRTLVPLDLETIVDSVRRTNRLVVAHEAVEQGGFGAEVAAAVQAAAFDFLDAPIERVGAPFAPVPFSPSLEDAYLPGADEVHAAVQRAAA
jgi:pyruvate/2-oxoglutarate/acetoin dehydrogenase E1 component